MRWLWKNSERLSHVATLITAIVAIVAVLIAVIQIQAARRTQQEDTAQQAYKEYLKLAFEHGGLANGQPTDTDRVRYEWFVSYLLYSAEQIFDVFSEDEAWRSSLRDQLCYHRNYLGSRAFQSGERSHYDAAFLKFVDQAIKKCAP
jgi:hypothetical protein